MNQAHIHRFCNILNTKLNSPQLENKTIYYTSDNHPHKVANAVFLLAAWCVLQLNVTPKEAFEPFKYLKLSYWHDATPTPCDFKLTVLDTLHGIRLKYPKKRFMV